MKKLFTVLLFFCSTAIAADFQLNRSIALDNNNAEVRLNATQNADGTYSLTTIGTGTSSITLSQSVAQDNNGMRVRLSGTKNNDGTFSLATSGGGGGSTGTVTSASVVTNNGVSATVSNPTTTPAFTFTLGAITPTTVNGLTITPTTGTFTLANAKTFVVNNGLTLSGTDGSTLNIGTGGTLGTNAFNSTAFGTGSVTSVSVVTANGVSGSVATATTTPAITLTLGAITPTTVNGNTFTTGTYTLTGVAGKTLTFNNNLTLSGTDGSTLNIGAGGTLGTNAFNSTAYLPLAGGTMLGNLLFTDNTYDIGATGATRPRNLFLAGNGTISGTLAVTGHDTFEGVTSTGATGTGALVFGTTPSFTTSIKTPAITVPSDSTTAFQIFKADGATRVVDVDTTNARVGINRTPTNAVDLDVNGGAQVGGNLTVAGSSFLGNETYFSTGTDIGATRNASGVLEINNGSAGVFAGFKAGVVTFATPLRSSGSASYFTITTPTDTGQTAATESIGANYGSNATRTWVDGTVATQREHVFQAPTYGKTTTSATFTKAATLAVVNAPQAGLGVTLSAAYALWVQAGLAQLDGGINTTNISQSGTITTYNGVATAGIGFPQIVAAGRVTAQSAANASISTYTAPAVDSSYEVSMNMNVTVATSISASMNCTYTDESNTPRTMILPTTSLAGTFVAGGLVTAVGAYETPVIHIRCKASTAITLFTAAGTYTGVTYTAEGNIKRTK